MGGRIDTETHSLCNPDENVELIWRTMCAIPIVGATELKKEGFRWR